LPIKNKPAIFRLINPIVAIERETNVLKKFVKAAGFGLNHVNEEFTSGDLLNKLIAVYKASCGAAATNVFLPIRLSSYAVFMQL
jgi:hypothetical protein